MLVEAMKRAGSVDDVAKIRKELLSMTYDGLWKISFDEHAEEIFNFDVVHMTKGGKISVTGVEAR
jgi:branched-chain amino acid transport system substrate-binding protein